ncbi:hypothetical protein JCM30471_01780 [Desulfuromonas carbonis]|uniref:radical SAM protein n=1 Tax=Desulfuromonas sp. DDH964 TaxID=1823759 RepID=UPI00078BD622|nr:radical SAM protein [Desulfuromonas sp. DDH964]AMV71762.1 Cyclic pyranopterin monophosphate synthase [Desulfuromonas sp. DDH964]
MGNILVPAARERRRAANREEFSADYNRLHFPDAAMAAAMMDRRGELLAQLAGQVELGCGGTKLDCSNLAPGCRICVAGGWSCLFINGRCNCRCFYCPTGQEATGLPTTNTVEFRTPADYVRYLELFGFSGASISGGEPLLTPGRSLAFITAIKRRFGAAMPVWLYTNGTLLTADLAARLADAGLDEIRFDIGATGYHLDALRRAVGVIPTVTVEIPAIPEEAGRLKEGLLTLREAGVDHLNLHQLRLTPYNLPQLVERGYTFLHGEKVTVLESELAALELLRHSVEWGIGLPVNYCSFVYKNRHQAQAARLRNGRFLLKSWEESTAAGYLRTLALVGTPAALARQEEEFRAAGVASTLWNRGSGRLAFHPQLLPLVDFSDLQLVVGYATARQRQAVSYHNPFTTVRLSPSSQVIIERARVGRDFELSGDLTKSFTQTFLGKGGESLAEIAAPLLELLPFERLPTGLADYY